MEVLLSTIAGIEVNEPGIKGVIRLLEGWRDGGSGGEKVARPLSLLMHRLRNGRLIPTTGRKRL